MNGLEAHGLVHLSAKSCVRCLVNVYNKYKFDDWEAHAQKELDLVLGNFQLMENRDLLLLPEPVMANVLGSNDLAVTSEKMVLDRLVFWMNHELVPADGSESGRGANGQLPLSSAGSASSNVKVARRAELRGKELLKHIRWPEYQREGLSEMFVSPDPVLGELISLMVIESLAWANFPLETRKQRIANSDPSQHPKYIPKHAVFPREVYTLHTAPTPCTLRRVQDARSTPYILHPTPCTLPGRCSHVSKRQRRKTGAAAPLPPADIHKIVGGQGEGPQGVCNRGSRRGGSVWSLDQLCCAQLLARLVWASRQLWLG